MYNENIGDVLDQDIQQGLQFTNYGKKYYEDNEHKLLEESSSPLWGSIVEAFNGPNSVKPQNPVPAAQAMLNDQKQFNDLVSKYANAQNTYSYTILSNKRTDLHRTSMEKDIATQRNNLIKRGKQIQTNNTALLATNNKLRKQISTNQPILKNKAMNLNQQRMRIDQINKKYDKNTLGGLIETTELTMNSMYYHYLVYFLISVTLIAFTFNILVNPNANVMNAIIVVCTIIMIYLITRHYTVYI
jgi:hypothetical protein